MLLLPITFKLCITCILVLVGIGDSITAGVHSEGGNMTYPAQLQTMLDTKYPGKYKVTNLGACGSTMMKGILLKYS